MLNEVKHLGLERNLRQRDVRDSSLCSEWLVSYILIEKHSCKNQSV